MKNVRIYDRGEKAFDRYTAVYMDEPEAHGLYGIVPPCRGVI
jgi:hypothetical protein